MLEGGRSSRCHFTNPSSQLQVATQEAKNGTRNPDRTDSTLHGLSSEVDKEVRELLTVKQEEAKDVFIDDLSATLEAHRTTNRATIVRKLEGNAKKSDERSLGFKSLNVPSRDPKTTVVDAPAKDGFTSPGEQGVEASPNTLRTSMIFDNTKDHSIDLHRDDIKVATEEKAVSDKQQVEKPGYDGMRRTNWPADSVQNQRRRMKRYSVGRNEVLEYDAMYIPPTGDYRRVFSLSRPWLRKLSNTFHTKKKGETASRR